MMRNEYHPDNEINAEVLQETTESELADLAAGYNPRWWECPQCSASHQRGYFGSAPNHRCLNCGYVGNRGVMTINRSEHGIS